MAYIGNIPAEKFTSVDIQNFTVSATANYTLDRPVANENEIELFINNVRQHPGSGKAYTASGTALTLSEATAGTDTMYCVYQGKARQTVTPATSSVTNAMLAGSIDLTSKVTGALPQANIADEAINEAKMQISNAPTNGYMLTAQSGNTGGLTWAEAPSGGLVLVGGSEGTSDVSEVNIDNCFTSTYKQYIVRVIIAPDANADIRFRFRTGGASGSTRTNSDHFWLSEAIWRSESDGSQGESLATAHGDDKWKISYDAGYDSTAALTTATINFYDPYGSQFSRQYWNAISFWQYYTGGKNYGGHFHGKTQSNVTATGLNFSPASGNIYYHSIKVYGMVNS